MSIYQGHQAYREEPLVVLVKASTLVWIPDGHMLLIQGSYDTGDVLSQPEVSLQLLPALWSGGAGQVLSNKLINDGPAHWDDKLGYGPSQF